MNSDPFFLVDLFPDSFVDAALGLLLLILVDAALGVGVAIRHKQFDTKRMADFYHTSVLRYLLGWMLADVVLRLLKFRYPTSFFVGPFVSAGTVILYGIVVLALSAQIADKVTKWKAA